MSMFCVVGDFDLNEKNNLMSRKHTKKDLTQLVRSFLFWRERRVSNPRSRP